MTEVITIEACRGQSDNEKQRFPRNPGEELLSLHQSHLKVSGFYVRSRKADNETFGRVRR